MEDKSGFQKPLRRTFDKGKDILNTYKKNEEKVIPINDDENENISSEEINIEESIGEPETAEEDNPKDDMGFFSNLINNFSDKSDEIEKLKKEKDDLKEQLVRKAAELENIRKRHIREKSELIEYGNQRLLHRFIELFDDINSASDASKKSNDFNALAQGLDMIRQKAAKLFEEQGVKTMEDPVGTPFDVHLQEAMMTMPSEQPEGTVVQVLQPGYMIQEKVLRHAKVITSSGNQ